MACSCLGMLCHLLRVYTLHRRYSRFTVVSFCKLATVGMCSLLVSHLLAGSLYVMFIHGPLFFRAWPCSYPAASAIIAYMVVYYRVSLDYRTINISIMYYRSVYIYHSSIIPEVAALPSATGETNSKEASSVVNTTVKSYTGSPISGVVQISATIITPVAGRPV